MVFSKKSRDNHFSPRINEGAFIMITIKGGSVYVPRELHSTYKNSDSPIYITLLVLTNDGTEDGVYVAYCDSPMTAMLIGKAIADTLRCDWVDHEAERIIALFQQWDVPYPTNPNVLVHALRYVYNRQDRIQNSNHILNAIIEQLYYGRQHDRQH